MTTTFPGLAPAGFGSNSSIGTLTPSGAFSPSDSPLQRPNPFRDPLPWFVITIGAVLVPGVVTSIDGQKPEEWEFQKGSSSSNATSVWKGTKLAESIEIETSLFNATEFDGYYDIRDVLRPKIGTKPPSLTVFHPALNFSGITRVSVIDVLPPKWVPSGAYWTGKIILCEYNPSKPAKAGPADPAKWHQAKPSENDKLATELEKAMAEAKSL